MTGKVITLAQQKGGSGKTTLAANLAVAFRKRGLHVALLDTDPQGSLGRWFMMRREQIDDDQLEFATASAWGVSYECGKLRKLVDIVIVDTPPKVDADLRPALREADLIVVPVAASHVDLWATDGVLDLASRENQRPLIVLNRSKGKTRLAAEIAEAVAALDADVATGRMANRVAYAESMGQGRGVLEGRPGPAAVEIEALADELLTLMGD